MSSPESWWTDVDLAHLTLPVRLGVTGRWVDDHLVLDVAPNEALLAHGVVRTSVLSYAVDAVAGIHVDQDPSHWSLTSDMTVRTRPVPAPARVSAANTIVRAGRRSATCTVALTDDAGRTIGSGAVGFVRVPRRDGDPPKPQVSPEQAPALFPHLEPLDRPLRDAAGIEVLDAPAGVVDVLVTPNLRNPAGTIQGAMVALLAEAAVEELIGSRFGPAVVTDLDLRYLAQAPVGPIRTRCELLGDTADATVVVELFDTSADRLTTLVYARATPV